MRTLLQSSFLFCLVFTEIFGRKGFGSTDQEWGYVDVRPKSHIFYWLHYTTATSDPLTRPLVIWLQGGPGESSTGIGNFGLIGPLNPDLQVRNTSWVNYVNLLFVDSPVGTGFSYAEDAFYTDDNFAVNNSQIASDFLAFMQGFYDQLPQFKTVPTYLFSEAYGGKMCIEIALVLYENIQNGNLTCNLTAIALGDPLVSPIDSILTWPNYLLNLGLVDTNGLKAVTALANTTAGFIQNGLYHNATYYWKETVQLIRDLTDQVNTENVLSEVYAPSEFDIQNIKLGKPFPTLRESDEVKIFTLMDDSVKDALNISHDYGKQTSAVYNALQGDFLKDVTDVVETVLNTTDLKVVIYNGQLDLTIDTPGTVNWVNRLNWKNIDLWRNATRRGLGINNVYEGYQKTGGNLSFYWVARSGEMVPVENPTVMEYILKNVTNNYEV